MERIELIKRLFDAKRKVTLEHNRYLSIKREYVPGETLYMREVHFIVIIGESKPATMGKLAALLDVSLGAASQLAAQMQKKGYVVRQQNAADKRKNTISLTTKGDELYHIHAAYDAEKHLQVSEMMRSFTDEQLQLFVQYEQTILGIFI